VRGRALLVAHEQVYMSVASANLTIAIVASRWRDTERRGRLVRVTSDGNQRESLAADH
jgi:hypothetical protein